MICCAQDLSACPACAVSCTDAPYSFSSTEELKAAAKAWCKDKDAAMGNAPHVTNELGPS